MEKILELTRALGKEIQSEECYKAYLAAKDANDNDEALQKEIGQFNMVKLSIDQELTRDEQNGDKVKELNEELRRIYSNIMVNESMQAFQKAKGELDALISGIYSVITKCVNGENPETATMEENCTGNCSSCSGCR